MTEAGRSQAHLDALHEQFAQFNLIGLTLVVAIVARRFGLRMGVQHR